MPSKFVAEITKRINEIHDRKNQDYAQEGNPFSNFERMSTIAEWFNDPVHKSFVSLIGVKLARLAELLNGKTPKNESIDDSFLDLCTYCVLFHAYYLTHLQQIDTQRDRVHGIDPPGYGQNNEHF